MSVTKFEPAVVHQLLEFTHRYSCEVLEEAKYYAEYADKKDARGVPATEVDLDDLKLAIQTRVNFSFMQPPSRATLSELVRKKNGIPLPLLQAKTGVRLPPSKYCLTAPNFQLLPKARPPYTAAGHVMSTNDGDSVPVAHSTHRASSNPIAIKIKSEQV